MINLQHNVPLAERTTINLGGNARYFVECSTTDEVCAALRFAAASGMPLHVLGGGSNTIFRDEGFDGLVLKIAMTGTQFIREPDSVKMVVAAGEEWDTFVRYCVAMGLAGVECLSGIPGLVGAAPMQNVGAYGQEVAETIVQVKAIDRISLNEVRFLNEDCKFSYRRSRFNTEDLNAFVITEVMFRLQPGGKPTLRYPELQRYVESNVDLAALQPGAAQLGAVREAVLALRKKKSMVIDPTDPNSRSVGSFFKNPILSNKELEKLNSRCRTLGIADEIPTFPFQQNVKIPAAWLVEKAGFPKGYRREGVGVSSNHSLALVNFGGTARALLRLAEEIEAAVFARFGIRLAREPVVVP